MDSQIAAIFLECSADELEHSLRNIETCLGKLSEEQVWHKAAAHENSIGNLMLHLAGNVRQWIGHGVGGEPDIRTRPAEFAPDEQPSKAQLHGSLRDRVNHAIAIIHAVSPERLSESITPQGREVSVLEAIYHVVAHFHEHAGQIILLAKQLGGASVEIYKPNP